MTSTVSKNASFYQDTNNSISTLRPRNNLSRLISYDDDPFRQETVAATPSASSTPPRLGSRASSPSANERLRTKGKPQATQSHGGNDHARTTSELSARRPSSGIWESWSSFQGIASSFLGSEQPNGSIRRASSVNKPQNGRMQQDKTYGLKQTQAEWGPRTDSNPKPASIEEQRAILQAKRRELLMLQGNAAAAGRNSLGRHKRKDSDASIRTSIADNMSDSDVLVYRHKVQTHDTMAGVVIKYSCQPEVFRKVNRFWPNDNVQRKEYVILPVDACTVRGRKTDGPYVADLLDERGGAVKHPSQHVNGRYGDSRPDSPDNAAVEPFPLTDTTPLALDVDSPYKHDSWVILPSQIQPVEILRISKRALGYFPPARRKSSSNDSPPLTLSGASTPKTSFDTLRHPLSHAAQQAQLSQHLQATLSVNHSPVRQSSLPRYLNQTSRTRSSSTVSNTNETSQNAFLSALSGPGGVGTLRGLRTERAKPGPGDDPLNKKFAQYASEYLPSDHPDYRHSTNDSLKPPNSRRPSSSLRATPRASIDSIRSSRSNSSTMPSSIAGWVGKVTSSPMRKKPDLIRADRGNMDLTLSVLGEVSEGRAVGATDLIELADTPDEVSRQLHDAVEERTPTATPLAKIGGLNVDTEDSMNERFPIRGRVRRAYETD